MVVLLVVEVPLKMRLLPESHPSPVHCAGRKTAAKEHVEDFLGRHVCKKSITFAFGTLDTELD